MRTPVFLYDGDCAFCTRCADFLERCVRTEAAVAPWQSVDLEALGIGRRAVEDAVQWAEPGLVKAGPDAIAMLLCRAQWYWRPLGLIAARKFVSRLLWPVYRLVSRNRHRLPGGTAACAISRAEDGLGDGEAPP